LLSLILGFGVFMGLSLLQNDCCRYSLYWFIYVQTVDYASDFLIPSFSRTCLMNASTEKSVIRKSPWMLGLGQ